MVDTKNPGKKSFARRQNNRPGKNGLLPLRIQFVTPLSEVLGYLLDLDYQVVEPLPKCIEYPDHLFLGKGYELHDCTLLPAGGTTCIEHHSQSDDYDKGKDDDNHQDRNEKHCHRTRSHAPLTDGLCL